MKTFREFIIEVDAAVFGSEEEQKRVAERDAKQAKRRAARTGMSPEVEAAESKRKAFEKAGLSPEEAKKRAYRNITGNTRNVSSAGVGFGGQRQPPQPSGTTSSPPKTPQQPPQPSGTTSSPPKTPQQPPQPSGTTSSPPKTPQQPPQPSGTTSSPPPKTPQQPPQSSTPPRASAGGLSTTVKPTVKPTVKTKIPGLKSGAALSAVVGAADEKMKGSGNLRALAKGATMAVGTVLGGLGGGALGSLAGPTGTVIGGYAGQAAGAELSGKAFDTVAGANAVTRKAMATANRQRQAGGGLAGIGGQTTFSKGKDGTGFMSTGVGNQRKTVQLAKTSVVKDPKTGKLETGNLAFKDGKAVYKRAADPSTLAQTSSNPLERVGRSLFAGAYKQQDEKARQARLAQAVQSDIKRQRELGVKGSQNLVGPKIVGPKIVGPKPTPSKPAGGGMGGRRGGGSSPGSIKPTTK